MPLAYTIVQLEQGSEQWLQWRRQGIGASDAPIIMNENPWENIHSLRQKKIEPTVFSTANEAMARGIAHEPIARALYSQRVGIHVTPACVQSTDRPWLRASLDGISADGQQVVEIKCGRTVYQKTAATRRPPVYYTGQLQHILAVTNLPSLDFWCHLPNLSPLHLKVSRDDAYIDRLLKAEEAFWETVKGAILP